jgi:serine-type D-Ala-D-Ala carboxypeptidase
MDGQEKRFASAFTIIEDAIENQIFPCASVAVTCKGRLIGLKSFGQFIYNRDGVDSEIAALSPDSTTSFDLASLTKPIATTTMAMILYDRKLLGLEAPVVRTVPQFRRDSAGADARREEITFQMLLAHSSGLPAYEKLFLRAHSRDDLLQAAFAVPLTAEPGSRVEYSDVGFIVLGEALERIAGASLDVFCQREVFDALGMIRTMFRPLAESRRQIPPTADERVLETDSDTKENENRKVGMPRPEKPSRSTFRKRIVQGEVQDENASVLGGVAGHAGLFATAEDLARFANALLRGGSPITRPQTVDFFKQRQSLRSGTSRALGWDTPSTPSQSGKYFGSRSYGHLGYTGTSLWIDPERDLSITLLTNRTWPDCANPEIKLIRPKFHDAVVEAIS